MKRIYVAGLYSRAKNGNTANVIEVLDNMRKGIGNAVHLLNRGFSVFCPWLDFQFGLAHPIPKKVYQNNSMAWLEVSDAVLVISGAGLNSGVDREIERADQLGIPVFYSIEGLLAAKEDMKHIGKMLKEAW